MMTSIDRHGPTLLIEQGFRRHYDGRFARALASLKYVWLPVVGLVQFVVIIARDLAKNARDPATRLLRVEGRLESCSEGSLLLYAHFDRHGRVSTMVLTQLREYARLGFRVVFVTGSATLPEEDWQSLREVAEIVVQRRNFGLDFGSWSDVLRTVVPLGGCWNELLLANDSVVGPLRPLDPVLAQLRAGGEGVFGLTEGVQHGSHLQSYFVLARGRAACTMLATALRRMRLSDSKARTIQRGELGLSKAIRRAGLPLAALHSYAELERLAAASPATRESLAVTAPRLGMALYGGGRRFPLRRALLETPLNPMHHFASLLVHELHFPFLKTALLLENPARIPEALDWQELIPADATCGAALVFDHLTLRSLPPAVSSVPPPPEDDAYAAWIAAHDTLDDADRGGDPAPCRDNDGTSAHLGADAGLQSGA